MGIALAMGLGPKHAVLAWSKEGSSLLNHAPRCQLVVPAPAKVAGLGARPSVSYQLQLVHDGLAGQLPAIDVRCRIAQFNVWGG